MKQLIELNIVDFMIMSFVIVLVVFFLITVFAMCKAAGESDKILEERTRCQTKN